MEALSNILESLIINSGLSENELSKRMDITVATLNKIKTGAISNPTLYTLNNIAQFFGITIDQLIGKSPLETFFSKNLCCVPCIDINKLIHLDISTLDYSNHKEWMRIELTENPKNHNIFATHTFGDAMFPLLDSNTLIIVDTDEPIINKSLVLAHIYDTNEILIRKILIDGSFKVLKPTNNSFPEIKITENDKIIGTIIATFKNHKKTE